jgi:hypothetical protein
MADFLLRRPSAQHLRSWVDLLPHRRAKRGDLRGPARWCEDARRKMRGRLPRPPM